MSRKTIVAKLSAEWSELLTVSLNKPLIQLNPYRQTYFKLRCGRQANGSRELHRPTPLRAITTGLIIDGVLETQMKGKICMECFSSVEGYELQENSIFHSLKYKNRTATLHD